REDLKITKDLFFSGHVSALCLLYYLVQNKKLKYYIFIAAVVVGTLLIWQRVHYTIDVLFAPIGAWITHQTIIYFLKVRVNLVNRRTA
ncbi:MAG TPA: phosphatase PAP2-related protein, partial [Saprospiraceae bacterium]|nr:phosphatase PAP2-related protein [Saprospiraceae bacterium]